MLLLLLLSATERLEMLTTRLLLILTSLSVHVSLSGYLCVVA